MKKPALYIILFITLTISSCELNKELQFKGFDEFNSKIVIHGFISPNNGAEVVVRKSLPVNDVNSISYLKDAEVTLFEDGTPLFHLSEIDSGYFVSPPGFIPVKNKGYIIEVSAPGFPEATSTTQFLMPEIVIDSLILVRDSITHQGYFLDFSFNDPADVENFYHFEYLSSESPEPVFPTDSKREFILGSIDDTAFDGESIWQRVQYYDNINDPENKVINGYLFCISADFESFISSLDEYDYTKETIFFPTTSSVYSNISGGYGIFASYTYTTKYLIIN